jgi:hypothetical protein
MIHRGDIRRNLSPDEASSSSGLTGLSLTPPTLTGEVDIDPERKLRGYFAVPPNHPQDQRYPSLLILGGSEGGIFKEGIDQWAARGYVALGVAYHKGYNETNATLNSEQAKFRDKLPLQEWGQVPDVLSNIELSSFQEALNCLRAHPLVANDIKPTLIGTSRGGELALLLGTIYPDAFRAIVALVPCGTINGGSSWNSGYRDRSNLKAWLKDGQSPCAIDVIKINAPIFAASGGKDDVWTLFDGLNPDSINAEKILASRTNPNDVKLHLMNTGHGLWDEKNNPELEVFFQKLREFRLRNFPNDPVKPPVPLEGR